MRKLKIGLDIHGVIDRYPLHFKWLSGQWKKNGHEVHIVTGQEWENCKEDCKNIKYVDHFSIVDYHLENVETEMWRERGKNGVEGWWMDREVWLKSKGEYARNVGLDIHFDDSFEYFEWFPYNCTCILVPKVGFDAYCLDCFCF